MADNSWRLYIHGADIFQSRTSGPNVLFINNHSISLPNPIKHGNWIFTMSIANLLLHPGPGGSSMFLKFAKQLLTMEQAVNAI